MLVFGLRQEAAVPRGAGRWTQRKEASAGIVTFSLWGGAAMLMPRASRPAGVILHLQLSLLQPAHFLSDSKEKKKAPLAAVV